MNYTPPHAPAYSTWALRAQTMAAAVLILRAQWLIRRVPMSDWHGSLGRLVPAGETASAVARPDPDIIAAAALARRVRRAAARFPTEPKCLPQAMALQWMLGRRSTSSRLVIAMHQGAETAASARAPVSAEPHQFHAWVELGDAILIGQCDRREYRAILTFEHRPVAERQPPESAWHGG